MWDSLLAFTHRITYCQKWGNGLWPGHSRSYDVCIKPCNRSFSNSEDFMPSSMSDNSALYVQTSLWLYTARTNMNANRKASIIGCEQKSGYVIEPRGVIIIIYYECK